MHCELPVFVRDLLGSPPKVGQGVNPWLFRTARVLHPYRRENEIVELLHAALHGERIRSGEIERAVTNSKAVAWMPDKAPHLQVPPRPAWPPLNEERQRQALSNGFGTADLCDSSPVHSDVEDGSDAGEILELLFSTVSQPDPLLCVGRNNSCFATRPLSVWMHSGKLATSALVVPSPMTSRTGRTKQGKESEHTLENTGARRFLIVEFDKGSTDDHAALLWHLATLAPLALVVHSGGKSCHGWFYCSGQAEEDLHRFMRYAVSIGADHATWTRSQFVRLPAGQRENGARQQVFYFDPAIIQRTEDFAHGH